MARQTATRRSPKLIDGYTRKELERKRDIYRRLVGVDGGLRQFIQRRAPQHAPVPRHLDPLIDAIERARFEKVRICVSMPPGHAKTITILRAIAWWLSSTPEDTCAYVSYSDRQAWGKSKIGRAIAEEAGVELDDSAWGGAEWRTVEGGGLLAAGVGGRLTGQRITGLAVIDDPFKSRDDANSDARREEVWSYYSTVARTRLENASILICHTRWHQDDLIGRLAEKEGWTVINLPALNDNGEALWEEMYPAAELKEIKEEIGEYDFSALYQGRPVPRGAKVFGPEHYYDQDRLDLTGCKILLAGDPAATDNTTADYGAIAVLAMRGRGVETYAYVTDFYRQQVTVPQYARDLRAKQVHWGNPRAGIESNGAFKVVPQLLREADPTLRVKEIIALGDKFQRAQPVAAAWNGGRVLVPIPTDAKPVPWLKDFLHEVSRFTGIKDAHDDQVDALAHAWNMGYQKGGTVTISDKTILARRI